MNISTYISLLDSTRAGLREGICSYGEMEMQARFYRGEFGLAWTGVDGETIEAIHLGEWNREPGPDFVNALIRIDGVEKRGDIEIDPEAVDWERHGHAVNPAFDGVLLHIFSRTGGKRFYTATTQRRVVTQVCLQPVNRVIPRAAKDALPARPSTKEAVDFIEAAAQFRLAKKREAWLRAEALHGVGDALFQGVATGLGYKNNKIPFLLTAQRTSLERAARADGEALLFGIAGFLAVKPFASAGEGGRTYLRQLWDTWWKMQDAEVRVVLLPAAWNFAGARPQNHPHRRLAALALAARKFSSLRKISSAGNLDDFLDFFGRLEHDFFSSHASLGSKPFVRPCALVGGQRCADLAANVLAPMHGSTASKKILQTIQPGTPSSRAIKAAAWLSLDASTSKPLLASAWYQQGLLQAFADFYPELPI